MLRNSFSSASVYSFSSLLFHTNLCRLSSSVKFEVFVLSMRVGYFHKILSRISLWSEKVVKVCTERYCIKFVWEMILETKIKSTVVQPWYLKVRKMLSPNMTNWNLLLLGCFLSNSFTGVSSSYIIFPFFPTVSHGFLLFWNNSKVFKIPLIF